MKNYRYLIFGLIGAILGVMVVRVFLLNTLETVAWNLFWNNLSRLNWDMLRHFGRTETFKKIVFGCLIGCAVGLVSAKFIKRR